MKNRVLGDTPSLFDLDSRSQDLERKCGKESMGIMGLLTFIIVFGIIVVVHEYGHFYFAKSQAFSFENLPLEWDRKSFSYWKDGTAYTIRILPSRWLYVRMAGWVMNN